MARPPRPFRAQWLPRVPRCRPRRADRWPSGTRPPARHTERLLALGKLRAPDHAGGCARVPDVTDLHQFTAYAAVAATLVLVCTGVWSIAANRRSSGGYDHRFAVDRSVLIAAALLLANGAVGLVLASTGHGPADALHFVYGPAALVTIMVGAALSRRTRLSAAPDVDPRRDGWLFVAAVALLAIEARLFMTG